MEALDWWERLGFPAAITAALIFALFRGGGWLGMQVLLPLRERHAQVLSRTEELLGAQGDTLRRLVEVTGQVSERISRMEGLLGHRLSGMVEPGEKRGDRV